MWDSTAALNNMNATRVQVSSQKYFSKLVLTGSFTLWYLVRYVKPKTVTTYPKTIHMYHTHTFGASKCMRVVNSGGFRFGDHNFGYTYVPS